MLNLRNLYDLGLHIGTEFTTKYPVPYDIFSGITLPEGSPFSLLYLKSVIMERCGLLIPIYQQPDVMHDAITLWSIKYQWAFIHLAKVINAEYSPIENVYEEDTQNTATNGSKTITSHSSTGGADNSSTENTTSAYNAATYQPDNKTDNVINYGQTKDSSGGDSTTGNTSFTRLRHGNIGVTTNTQLINEELELLDSFNAYGFIAELFEKELCIMVY